MAPLATPRKALKVASSARVLGDPIQCRFLARHAMARPQRAQPHAEGDQGRVHFAIVAGPGRLDRLWRCCNPEMMHYIAFEGWRRSPRFRTFPMGVGATVFLIAERPAPSSPKNAGRAKSARCATGAWAGGWVARDSAPPRAHRRTSGGAPRSDATTAARGDSAVCPTGSEGRRLPWVFGAANGG